jgi:hypothetical protein
MGFDMHGQDTRFVRGLEGRDGDGLFGGFACGAFLLGILVLFEHFFNQEGDRALAFYSFAYFGGWGEEA